MGRHLDYVSLHTWKSFSGFPLTPTASSFSPFPQLSRHETSGISLRKHKVCLSQSFPEHVTLWTHCCPLQDPAIEGPETSASQAHAESTSVQGVVVTLLVALRYKLTPFCFSRMLYPNLLPTPTHHTLSE